MRHLTVAPDRKGVICTTSFNPPRNHKINRHSVQKLNFALTKTLGCKSASPCEASLVVAVTDEDCFKMIRKPLSLAEVNFWAALAANLLALQSGELFLFELHAPRNAIVEVGFLLRRCRIFGLC